MLRSLLALVAPPSCLACAAPVPVHASLCPACRAGLVAVPSPRCGRCGLPTPCGRPCPAARAGFDRSWAAVAYDGPARGLVLALKEDGRRAAASAMAARIAATVPRELLCGTLVPVPADARRLRARGVDHAGLLAREIARRTGAPLAPVLVRAGRSERQARAGRRDRLAAGRIGVDVRGAAPEHAILVDDVHTTGATLDVCARALRGAGAHTVTALAFARTLR